MAVASYIDLTYSLTDKVSGAGRRVRDSNEKHGEGWCMGFVPDLQWIARPLAARLGDTPSNYREPWPFNSKYHFIPLVFASRSNTLQTKHRYKL